MKKKCIKCLPSNHIMKMDRTTRPDSDVTQFGLTIEEMYLRQYLLIYPCAH